jgi:hypothetical protein
MIIKLADAGSKLEFHGLLLMETFDRGQQLGCCSSWS